MDRGHNITLGSARGSVRTCQNSNVRPGDPRLCPAPHQEPGVTALVPSTASPAVSVAQPPYLSGPYALQPYTPSGVLHTPYHGNPTYAAMRLPVASPTGWDGARAPGSNPHGPSPQVQSRHFGTGAPPLGNALTYQCCLPPTPWPGATASALLHQQPEVSFPFLDLTSTRPEPAPSSPLRQRPRRVEVIQADLPQAAKRLRR